MWPFPRAGCWAQVAELLDQLVDADDTLLRRPLSSSAAATEATDPAAKAAADAAAAAAEAARAAFACDGEEGAAAAAAFAAECAEESARASRPRGEVSVWEHSEVRSGLDTLVALQGRMDKAVWSNTRAWRRRVTKSREAAFLGGLWPSESGAGGGRGRAGGDGAERQASAAAAAAASATPPLAAVGVEAPLSVPEISADEAVSGDSSDRESDWGEEGSSANLVARSEASRSVGGAAGATSGDGGGGGDGAQQRKDQEKAPLLRLRSSAGRKLRKAERQGTLGRRAVSRGRSTVGWAGDGEDGADGAGGEGGDADPPPASCSP